MKGHAGHLTTSPKKGAWLQASDNTYLNSVGHANLIARKYMYTARRAGSCTKN